MNKYIKTLFSNKHFTKKLDKFLEISGLKLILKDWRGAFVYDNCRRSVDELERALIGYDGETVCEAFFEKGGEKAVDFFKETVIDFLNLKSMASEVLDKYREINILYDAGTSLSEFSEISSEADRVIGESQNLLEFDCAMIALKNGDFPEIINTAAAPADMEAREELRFICKIAMESKKAEIINRPTADTRFASDDSSCFRAFMFAPLVVKDRTIGSMAVCCRRDYQYMARNIKALSVFSAAAAVAIENARLYEELRESTGQIVCSLVEAVEKNEQENVGHSIRVAGLCIGIGRKLNIAPSKLIVLKFAAFLHDIGKIGLGRDDYKKHPANGCQIVRHVKKFGEILPAIMHHHEKYDGTGFPDGLAGRQIPLLARIISAADYYDSLVNRKHCSPHDALERIKNLVDKQFDAQVVAALFECCSTKN